MINIKFLILFFSLSSLVSCGEASQATSNTDAIITGHADFNKQWLYLVKPDPWLVKADIIDSCLIDENGKFSLSTNMEDMQEYLISGRGFFLTNVFLQNGYSLKLEIQGKGTKGKGKKLSFEGEGSDVNNFWYSMSNRFFKQGGYGKKYKQMVTDNDPKAYQLAYAAYNKLQTDALDSFMKAAKPPEFFEEWARSFVKYATLSKYYTYLFHKPRLSNSGTSYMAVDDSYYEFLNQVSMDVEPEIIHSSFNDFVYFYIVDYKARNLAGADDALFGSIEHAKTDLPETVGNMAIAHVVKDMIQTAASRNDYDRLRAILKDFENKPNTTKYAAFLDEKYKEKAVLAPGSPAPNFTLKDLDNNEVSLSDFKGSVVVLDFWGTWCGPCKRELPYSRKIEENFKDREDVVFLFVAMERGSRDYWKEFVNNNNLPGTHLYTSNDNRNLVPYKITSVPRYVLLDKEGNIYDAFASRPSQNMEVQIAKVLEL